MSTFCDASSIKIYLQKTQFLYLFRKENNKYYKVGITKQETTSNQNTTQKDDLYQSHKIGSCHNFVFIDEKKINSKKNSLLNFLES